MIRAAHRGQASFAFVRRGGRRAGAGRKPQGTRPNVVHRARPALRSRHPVHVTWRVGSGLESLRRRRPFHVVREALVAASERFGARIVHFSVQSNHLHLVCEAEDERSLARAMKGIGVRLARGLNALWGRCGRVLADRYHARAMKTPREVRHVLQYLLHNAGHHGIHFAGPDPCSSGAWFDGWEGLCEAGVVTACSVFPRAHTWLLAFGWRRHGLIPFTR